MALPLTPDPSESGRQERRLVDRAHFLGDAGRTGSADDGEETREDFEALLERRVKGKAADESEIQKEEEAGQTLEPQDVLPKAEARPKEGWTPAELEAHTREQTYREAERRGTWTGPTTIIGLPVVVGAALTPTGNVEGQERARREQETPGTDEGSPEGARVSPDLLEALRAAGLPSPITGLDDPRLSGAPRLEEQHGWRQGPTPAGATYLWEGPNAHQRLEWSDGHLMLETAAGTSVQRLERTGNQTTSRFSRRELPRRRVFRIED